jgi:hypothetical protein
MGCFTPVRAIAGVLWSFAKFCDRRHIVSQRARVQFDVQPSKPPVPPKPSLRALGNSARKRFHSMLGRKQTQPTPRETTQPQVRAKPQQTQTQDRNQRQGKQHKQIDRLLCESLIPINSKGCLPEVLYDGISIRHASGTSALRKHPVSSKIKHNTTDASLAKFLEQRTHMNLKEKRTLAVILAHSLLHFCEVFWLSEAWSKEHVLFFTDTGGFHVRRPYFSTDFQSVATAHDAGNDGSVHPNASVLALGILLLGIALQRPIEAQQTPVDLDEDGQPTVNTNYFTAAHVLEVAADEDYESYRAVVSACLGCHFYNPDTMKPSLDDLAFRQVVYDYIVMHLELDLRTGFPDVTLHGPSFINN